MRRVSRSFFESCTATAAATRTTAHLLPGRERERGQGTKPRRGSAPVAARHGNITHLPVPVPAPPSPLALIAGRLSCAPPFFAASCSAKHGGRPLAVAGAGREGVPAATVGVCRVRRGAAARVAVGVRVKGAPLRARRAPCVPERGVGATAAALPDGEFGGTNSGRIWRRARRPSVLSAMPKRFCLPARGPELRKCKRE